MNNELVQKFQFFDSVKNWLSRNFLLWLLIFLLCLEFFGHIYYLNTHFQNFINSDFVGDAILAKHLADTGNFILSSDWFPTTELYVIHHQLIMTPLFYFIDDYKTVWMITSVIAFILLSLSIIFFMRSCRASKEQSILAVVLFFNPLCKIYLEFNIYFHGYLFYFILGFLIIGLIVRILFQNELTAKYAISLSIISFLAGLCGIRMFSVIFVPLIFTFIFMNYDTPVQKLDCFYLKVLGLVLIFATLGAGGYVFLEKCCAHVSTRPFLFQDLDTIVSNMSVFPRIILKALLRMSESKICVIGGMIFWACCFFGIYKFRTTDVTDRSANLYRWLKIFTCISIVLNVILPIFFFEGGDFAFGQIFYGERFIALAGFLLIPIFVLILGYNEEKIFGKICSMIVVGLFLICGGYEYQETIKKEKVSFLWMKGSLDFLIRNNLKFGEATYWNANTIMFVSQNKLEILSVIDVTSLEIYAWNTRKSYMKRHPQFLMLTQDEFAVRQKAKKDDVVLYKDAMVVIVKM